jgi:hypothetical protein
MAPQLNAASRIVASKNQVSATLTGEAVILDMDQGAYYGLDAVGSRIWALIQEPRALDDVAATIEAEFDVTRERALADLLVLAGDMASRGLVEVLPAAPAS